MTTPVGNQVYSVANASTSTNPFITYFSTRAPTEYDLSFRVTQRWFDTVNNQEWILVSFTSSGNITTANWQPLVSSSDLLELTGDTGTAVPSVGAIKISGGTTGLTTAASGSTVDLTGVLVVSNGGTGDSSFISYAPVCGGISNTGALQSASIGFSNAGYVLTSNGNSSLPSWQSIASDLFAVTLVTTTPYVVLSSDYFLAVNVSSIAITIELPNAPSTGKVYYIKDSKGNASTNNITVTTVGGTVTIDGVTSYTMDANYEAIGVVFDGTSWEIF